MRRALQRIVGNSWVVSVGGDAACEAAPARPGRAGRGRRRSHQAARSCRSARAARASGAGRASACPCQQDSSRRRTGCDLPRRSTFWKVAAPAQLTRRWPGRDGIHRAAGAAGSACRGVGSGAVGERLNPCRKNRTPHRRVTAVRLRHPAAPTRQAAARTRRLPGWPVRWPPRVAQGGCWVGSRSAIVA